MTACVTAAPKRSSSAVVRRSGTTAKPCARNDSITSADTSGALTAVVCWQTAHPPARREGRTLSPVLDAVASRTARRPVPRLAGQVEEAEGAGMGGHPPEAWARAARHAAARAAEVDGEAALLHRRAGDGRRRRAAAGRLAPDGVVGGPTVLDAEPDLLPRVPVAAAAQIDSVAPGAPDQRVEVVRQRAVDGDRTAGRAPHRRELPGGGSDGPGPQRRRLGLTAGRRLGLRLAGGGGPRGSLDHGDDLIV